MFLRARGLGQAAEQKIADWGGWTAFITDAGEKAASEPTPSRLGTLATASDGLRGFAQAAGAAPVELSAGRLKAAAEGAKAAPSDPGKVADLRVAFEDVLESIQRESAATVEDRIRAEETIDRRMDRFEDRLRAWKAEHSGIGAVLDRIKGGPDLAPLRAELDGIKSAIDKTPLTREGRRRMLERHALVSGEVKAGDWKLLAAGGLGIIAWQMLSSGASAAARVGATYVSERRKPKKKRKKKS